MSLGLSNTSVGFYNNGKVIQCNKEKYNYNF